MIEEEIRCQPLPLTCTQTHTKNMNTDALGTEGEREIICMQNFQVMFK